MADGSEASPSFLTSLPSQPISDDIVKQIGESDNPKIRGAMGLPGSTPGSIEVFQLDLESKTHVIVFDPSAERWHVYKSFGTDGMSHQEIVNHASKLANEWLGQSFSDRIAATENTE